MDFGEDTTGVSLFVPVGDGTYGIVFRLRLCLGWEGTGGRPFGAHRSHTGVSLFVPVGDGTYGIFSRLRLCLGWDGTGRHLRTHRAHS